MQRLKVKRERNKMVGILDDRRRKKARNDGKHQQLSPSPLFCLPQELITEIITHVASSSFTDFFITKSTCKNLYEISEEEEGCIYRKISLENFPIIAWRNMEKHSQFFKKCHDNKNPEALYRKGVVHYFSGAKFDLAMEYLKEASNLGHIGAYYAIGVIYVFSNDEELKQKGIGILGGMKKLKSMRPKVKDYRKSLKFIISKIWKSPLIVREKPPSCCTLLKHQKKRGWSMDEIEEYEDICEACSSDIEIESICVVL